MLTAYHGLNKGITDLEIELFMRIAPCGLNPLAVSKLSALISAEGKSQMDVTAAAGVRLQLSAPAMVPI